MKTNSNLLTTDFCLCLINEDIFTIKSFNILFASITSEELCVILLGSNSVIYKWLPCSLIKILYRKIYFENTIPFRKTIHILILSINYVPLDI